MRILTPFFLGILIITVSACSNKEEVKSDIDHIMISMFQIVNPNLQVPSDSQEEEMESNEELESQNSDPISEPNNSDMDTSSNSQNSGLEEEQQENQPQQNWNSQNTNQNPSRKSKQYDSYQATDLDKDLLKAAEQLEKALEQQEKSK